VEAAKGSSKGDATPPASEDSGRVAGVTRARAGAGVPDHRGIPPMWVPPPGRRARDHPRHGAVGDETLHVPRRPLLIPHPGAATNRPTVAQRGEAQSGTIGPSPSLQPPRRETRRPRCRRWRRWRPPPGAGRRLGRGESGEGGQAQNRGFLNMCCGGCRALLWLTVRNIGVPPVLQFLCSTGLPEVAPAPWSTSARSTGRPLTAWLSTSLLSTGPGPPPHEPRGHSPAPVCFPSCGATDPNHHAPWPSAPSPRR